MEPRRPVSVCFVVLYLSVHLFTFFLIAWGLAFVLFRVIFSCSNPVTFSFIPCDRFSFLELFAVKDERKVVDKREESKMEKKYESE